jgi:hypothetical protein
MNGQVELLLQRLIWMIESCRYDDIIEPEILDAEVQFTTQYVISQTTKNKKVKYRYDKDIC